MRSYPGVVYNEELSGVVYNEELSWITPHYKLPGSGSYPGSGYLRGVGEVDEQLHGPLVYVSDHHLRLAALCQLSGKHGPGTQTAMFPTAVHPGH